jgi:hypothetical protein
MAGFLITYLILEFLYGKLALSQFLRGISIFNLIDTIIEQNVSELSIMFYFLFLFVFFLVLDRILIRRVIYSDYEVKQDLIIPQLIRYLREGAFTIPFIVMIGSPLLLQLILPIVIVFIALFELLIPFVIMGEVYRISENNLRRILLKFRGEPSKDTDTSKISDYLPKSVLLSTFTMILVFPITVFLLVAVDLDMLFHILHYMLLNENSGVGLSPPFWGIINTVIEVISFNIEYLVGLFNSTKHFIITFLVLIPICKLYILIVRSSRIQITRMLEVYVFKY